MRIPTKTIALSTGDRAVIRKPSALTVMRFHRALPSIEFLFGPDSDRKKKERSLSGAELAALAAAEDEFVRSCILEPAIAAVDAEPKAGELSFDEIPAAVWTELKAAVSEFTREEVGAVSPLSETARR